MPEKIYSPILDPSAETAFAVSSDITPEALAQESKSGTRRFYIESYGCQMNFSDSEIVASVLTQQGFQPCTGYQDADVVFINTCAIRENAEQKVRNRLKEFHTLKKSKPGVLIGLLGCMAERLKEQLLEQEKLVDIVVGPDAYRDLPRLVSEAESGLKAVNVLLSREETYADVNPVRLNSNGVSAFITIMRGCDNMCSFCVVPFTRGRERSRNPESIIQEASMVFKQGYREVTLLGQNVDSYLWSPHYASKKEILKSLSRSHTDSTVNFAQLLEMVAQIDPQLRVRFSTSNPRDMTDEVLHTIARYDNICKSIHLPVQSGSSAILKKMNRGHDREWYLERIRTIRRILPDCGITTDIICGFCSETEEDHQATLSLMEEVRYDWAFMFHYSERPGTLAARKYKDDVPLEEKKRRLSEVIALQQRHSLESNQKDVGKVFQVLIEGVSKKSDKHLFGRNSQNKVVVFDAGHYKPGDYVQVKITGCTPATLLGEPV
ncbi:MAG: tRNA-2-methylthio-N(6)-dimethylallyladenosine synthase [Chitinophagales bacterium]|nr:MAG: tRNA-2-methylthio-N(6)-dimethylallyladenosine synthase [Chitinophagales bacterium]